MTPPTTQSILWDALRNRPLTLPEKQKLREFYRGDYHQSCDYTSHHPWHLAIAAFRAQLAQAVFPDLGKVLDAGCAGGEEVFELRRRGIDAWGFDLCPDLHDIAYADVREYVRMGRFDFIPFAADDAFKTMVSYDVMEHVPIDSLQRFPAELQRLGISQVSCIISNDTLTEGHITIQDTDYYIDLFASAGYRLITEVTESLQDMLVPCAWNEQKQEPVYAPYTASGNPKNGWNQVPGHLFFESTSGMTQN